MNRTRTISGVLLLVMHGCASVETQGPDTRTDTGLDSAFDTAWDTGLDTGLDTALDTGIDTLADSGLDTGLDTALDTGLDTLTDSGLDTGLDTLADTAVEPDAPFVCGDGAVTGTEECDDGDLDPLDGCAADCTFETCGDGLTGDILVITDGFETGSATGSFSWTSDGPYTFVLSTTQAHQGTTSLGPSNIGVTSSTAAITLTAHTDGEICFWFAGQSESGFDDFRFRVDGGLVMEWNGDHRTWTEFCHTVGAGTHAFGWEYYKDSSTNTGWDAFYVDDVTIHHALSEQCDDGGTLAGDGCSPMCLREECGNAIVDFAEQCDDGDLESADGCSSTCTVEYCGDSVTGDVLSESFGFETGDLGSWSWADGAAYTFEVDGTQTHTGSRALAPTNIGRTSSTATISLTEDVGTGICFWFAGQSESCCDDFRFRVDGALVAEWAGDHRTWTEFCHTVGAGTHVFVWEYYKDSSTSTGWDAFYVDDITLFRTFTEQCDDGGTTGGDGCSARCTVEECGNGILDVGEECDDANLLDGDGCRFDCTTPTCGDGVVGWSFPFDGFETGDLTRMPWSTGSGSSAWVVLDSPANAHDGHGLIASDNRGVSLSSAWIQVPLTTVAGGEICFYYRGESESCCDDFNFEIDGAVALTDAGAVTTWTHFCAPVAAGAHTFRWEYEKDGSISTGADRFSVDDVTFPPFVEQCDDGGAVPGDGCSSNCFTE